VAYLGVLSRHSPGIQLMKATNNLTVNTGSQLWTICEIPFSITEETDMVKLYRVSTNGLNIFKMTQKTNEAYL
jgi:hypothetical protein